MATQNVVDELIVTLTLDADNYQQVQVRIERESDRTFRNQQDRARRTDRTNRDQQKRLKDVAAGVKSFATQVTAAVGIVSGLGIAVGSVLTGFVNFETGLRRQAVGTALSNRQMQAWGATARRMGADANAGAEAIANLAREQKVGIQTGNAPTMVGLSKIGVNVNQDRPIEDILAQAQSIYRSAPDAQKQQYESSLLASGVSADLILMIKSPLNALDAFAQSFGEATEENRKAADAWASTLETLKANGIKVAGTLLTVLQPAIERGAEKLADLALKFADFADDLREAGGGVDAFQSTLNKHVPELGRLLEGFRMELGLIKGVTDVVGHRLELFGKALEDLGSWVMFFLNKARAPWGNKPLGTDLVDRFQSATGTGNGVSVAQRSVMAFDDWWRGLVSQARAGATPAALPRNIENDAPGLPRNIENDAPSTGRGPVTASSTAMMAELTGKYGKSVQEAAAIVANFHGESSLDPTAHNKEGGGTGARGLAQWRGARTEAFRKRYGKMPNEATWQQQIEFLMTDPYEKALLARSFNAAGDNSPMALGASMSKIFEGHPHRELDARRGGHAERLASTFNGQGAGNTVNIQNMTVQTPDSQNFVDGLQRIPSTQPYNTVIRP